VDNVAGVLAAWRGWNCIYLDEIYLAEGGGFGSTLDVICWAVTQMQPNAAELIKALAWAINSKTTNPALISRFTRHVRQSKGTRACVF
jgi:hypothetical protein